MKNLLKKLNIVPNQSDDIEGSKNNSNSTNLSKSSKLNAGPSPHSQAHQLFEHNKPFTTLAGWFHTVTNRKGGSSPSSSNAKAHDNIEEQQHLESASSCGLSIGSDVVARRDSESSNAKDPDIEEEYQIQLAMEMSAREDPEAVQIEAVKQISLGSFTPENTPAEVVAYRYWNYNALSYNDKILDGFYDFYGVITGCESSRMPTLVDLQAIPVSEGISWEAILVNRADDANLLKLEQKALIFAAKARSEPLLLGDSALVRQLATMVSDYMGGPVGEPENMLRAWKSLSYSLKSTLRSMVLPLGSLTIGLARHRALLFKVLADSVDIPCHLMKGQLYTGFDDVAVSFVRIDDGREFIVDLMSDPGTLIPSDMAVTHVDYADSLSSTSPLSRDIESNMGTGSSEAVSSFDEPSDCGTLDEKIYLKKQPVNIEDSSYRLASTTSANLLRPGFSDDEAHTSTKFSPSEVKKLPTEAVPSRSQYPISHARSPSWTEGVSSPAARKMKVKDVSQYMIDAAKENPQLAQKLHDVLLESGVVAPPNLFTEVYSDHSDVSVTFTKTEGERRQENKKRLESRKPNNLDDSAQPKFLPPLPLYKEPPRATPSPQLESLKPVQDTGIDNIVVDAGKRSTNTFVMQSDVTPIKYGKNVPVSAAAAAAAAVIASSMVVAVAKSSPDPKFEFPAAAAATATAAAVVATTAAVGKQYEHMDASPRSPDGDVGFFNEIVGSRIGEGDDACEDLRGSGKERDTSAANSEDRTSDRSAGGDSASSVRSEMPDDVSDCEISWDEITLGERIGLGSYGEVYRGDWRGTEVAVKRFLDQDIYGESLEEFKSEVRIMKRLRHPNVVLFMGAITRPPNLSIVTEFLHRGSLYRLLHRPNNQLDERRRLRMAFDAARGMNYLHTCSPVIVHRDLKSPNLLVDKNWVVKVCDFGLSRMKHNTYLSSRSTAGTAEWMAPEVLRNEPSDEKCDVYSFGVILWELCTLQQPWGGMNPMQVVGAVGFQHRRLDIPDDIDPTIADIICKCWQTDPKLRPTFTDIMAALKPLQKPIGPQLPRPSSSRSGE
ncbi:probable serine/threonine-protein kinase SIS8 isoform X1 [Chenopodium quinoa]|uniref:probable serine/threonine-protein kinase SIS8 isoform X1 n=3 Tax=Chenopodium quinoa TaxID=63459 RepID=UPI000B793B07|nr:probable serine/threonine-protein kinase SIS8 isoform X1 [Chenopodium quinoa]XP_021771158.1 probable serine/threonine-protein kinase SIS8 isoform X1 [Chenopodium quinoa]